MPYSAGDWTSLASCWSLAVGEKLADETCSLHQMPGICIPRLRVVTMAIVQSDNATLMVRPLTAFSVKRSIASLYRWWLTATCA